MRQRTEVGRERALFVSLTSDVREISHTGEKSVLPSNSKCGKGSLEWTNECVHSLYYLEQDEEVFGGASDNGTRN